MNHKRFYNRLAEKLPHPQLKFFNLGYAETDRKRYNWIEKADRRHKYHLSLVRHVLAGIDLAGKTVLEVGSGRGGNCYYLSRYTSARRIYGIDLCQGNVQLCRRNHQLGNIDFVQGHAEHLPFADGQFDIVLNLESSHCYPHFEQFLSEVHRVLKAKGIFCYADLWFLDVLWADWSQRKKALDFARFELLSEEDISEQIFQALKKKDGLPGRIRTMGKPGTRRFVNRVARSLEAVRAYLAAGQCSYKLWRFRKP